ncbi:uncharacterized protein LOC125423312 [Ziziphus jujuba]|uniref:Uncharacterized protein LOC125423312 n=1 Tax=Ziziphus jujuba TaxID=326968 RepID=A0ABM4A412_ZIZJJ|nr:uncharacterized protein LOC125423312 [Ziziphus jujuba]
MSFLNSLLDNDVNCISQLRMDRRTFDTLCQLLDHDGYVKSDGIVTLQEQVCIFLHIIAHHTKNRTIITRFFRSGETISRYFNSVLHGVLRLHKILLSPPKPISDNCLDDRWKVFKNCLGALDGTYIKVNVPEIDKPRYRTRKDSRVLRDALSRPNGLRVPTEMEVGGSSHDIRGIESRRTWSKGEEDALLLILYEVVASGQRCDTGSFKPGTITMIERRVAEICPNSGLRANPHIESKLKKWKKQYGIIYDMLNKSGFGWNDSLKCVDVDSDEVWKAYVQVLKLWTSVFIEFFHLIYEVMFFYSWQRKNERRVRNRITRTTELRTSFIDSLLDNDVTCISQLRMDRRTFVILCRLLRQDGYVKRDDTVTLEEQNCLGALDGTYIKVKVPKIDKPRYRTRKGEIATNVLGVCNPNMEFIFVLPGWEGSASDSRVLRDAISRPNGLKVPTAMEAGGSSNDNRWGESRRTWSRGEEEALLVLLDEAVASGQRCDTGAFKPGTLNMIERQLAEMCPNSGLRATPHIESKLKKWKEQYGIIYDMLNKSGFGWNDTLKCVEIDSDDAWKTYVQSNPSAKSWRDKPFPIYERLANIFGKDRATGHGAQTPIDLVNDINMEPDNDQIDDVGSPMSMNQTHSQLPTQSQLRVRQVGEV